MGVAPRFPTSCILTIVSAAFYAASFLWTDLCWFFSFFCFVPLFCQRFSSYRSACYTGFLWGSIAYGCTLSALLTVIVRWAPRAVSLWYAGAFWGYFIFFTMLWCCVARVVARGTGRWQAAWLLSTVLFFVWMHTGFFYFLTARWQGYGLASPLLPVMRMPVMLGLLPVIGWYGLLGALVGFQIGLAQKNGGWMLLGAAPFLMGCILYEQKPRNQKIALISQRFSECLPYERAQEVCHALLKAEYSHPQALVLVVPESAFPFPLNEYSYALEMWSLQAALSEKYIIVGSHYAERQKGGEMTLYNSAYVLYRGRIIYRYDKRWLLPFFEEHPACFWWLPSHSPFLASSYPFASGSASQEGCTIPDWGELEFRLCSELLWDVPKGKQVVALVHDGHYAPYFAHLFIAFAQFQALEKESNLAYCGWTTAQEFHYQCS